MSAGTWLRRTGAAVLAAVAVAAVASAPGLTACGGCDPKAECAARNGLTQESIDVGGDKHEICGEAGSIGTFYSGPDLHESGSYADWSAYDDNDQELWFCQCTITDGTLGSCEYTTK